jgi:hypothetical protein
MEHATRHVTANVRVETNGERSESNIATYSEGTGSAMDTAPQEIDS